MSSTPETQTSQHEQQPIDPRSLRDNPSLATATLDYRGTPVTFRLVTRDDAKILGDYFLGLSPATTRLYGPHPFDRATAEMLCANTDPVQTLRMIGTIQGAEGECVIAYMILILGVRAADVERYDRRGIPLNADTDCTLAPSVADAYQSKGLGSLLLTQLKQLARRVGRTRMVLWEGTKGNNHRAIHYYHKNGFRTVGEFQEPPGVNNYDMIMDL